MKLTRGELLDLYNGLHNVSNLPGAKWAYAVSKNIANLTPEFNALKAAFDAKENFAQYDRERVNLALSHAVKVDGVPQTVVVNGVEEYKVMDMEAFKKDFLMLQKKHSVAIKEREEQLVQYAELKKGSVSVDLVLIDPDNIPEGITPKQMSAIFKVIKEDN